MRACEPHVTSAKFVTSSHDFSKEHCKIWRRPTYVWDFQQNFQHSTEEANGNLHIHFIPVQTTKQGKCRHSRWNLLRSANADYGILIGRSLHLGALRQAGPADIWTSRGPVYAASCATVYSPHCNCRISFWACMTTSEARISISEYVPVRVYFSYRKNSAIPLLRKM